MFLWIIQILLLKSWASPPSKLSNDGVVAQDRLHHTLKKEGTKLASLVMEGATISGGSNGMDELYILL